MVDDPSLDEGGELVRWRCEAWREDGSAQYPPLLVGSWVEARRQMAVGLANILDDQLGMKAMQSLIDADPEREWRFATGLVEYRIVRVGEDTTALPGQVGRSVGL